MSSFLSYGTQQPIALLKLILEKQGFYDRSKDLDWKSIKDVSFIGAMIASQRCNVDGRFLSKFNAFTFDIPTDSIVAYTYCSILKGHLADFHEDMSLVAEPIVRITLNLFKVEQRYLLKTVTHEIYHILLFLPNQTDNSSSAAGDAIKVPLHIQFERSVAHFCRIDAHSIADIQHRPTVGPCMAQ